MVPEPPGFKDNADRMSRMEEEALRIWKLYALQPGMWEGWDHASTPVGFHDDGMAVLFGHPHPPGEFEERVAEGITYQTAMPKPVSFTANTSIMLSGIPTATVMWHQRDEAAMVALVSHEAFHAYQISTGCPMGNIATAMKYPVNDAGVQALAEVEAILLATELAGEGNLETVIAALDARASRQALLTDEVAEFEDEVELGEGLATYIEIHSAGPSSGLWRSKVRMLERLNRDGWGADRLRFYYSGMAWGLLCDRYAAGWQRSGWRPMAHILAESIEHSPDPGRRSYPGLEFSRILSRHELDAGKREERIRQTLSRAFPGVGLRVEIRTEGNPVGGGWNPNTAVTFPGEGRFHPDGLAYVYDTGTELRVEEDCLEVRNCRYMVFEGAGLEITVNGVPPPEGESRGSLEIVGDDCRVIMPMAVVRLNGRVLCAEELLK